MFNIVLTSSLHWLLTTTFWTLSDSQTNILPLRRFKLWCPEVQSSRYAVSVLAPTPTYSTIVQHPSKTVLFSCLLGLVIYELQIRLMKTDAWFRGCDPWVIRRASHPNHTTRPITNKANIEWSINEEAPHIQSPASFGMYQKREKVQG